MRIVIAVDWSDQSFNAVQVAIRLFTPDEVTLIHGIDMRSFESPFTPVPLAKQAHEELRQALINAGEKLLGQTAALVPSSIKSVRRLYQFGNPADVVLETAESAKADLIVLGSRGRGRMAEAVLGSVSHRVVQHASCSTLIVRGDPGAVTHAVLAIEGVEDAARLRSWLLTNHLARTVSWSVISVVPTPHVGDPSLAYGYAAWTEEMEIYAQGQVRETATALGGIYRISSTQVLKGDPVDHIADAAKDAQLVVIGSHGRGGVERLLLGSVSHAVLHHVSCPVLVIR